MFLIADPAKLPMAALHLLAARNCPCTTQEREESRPHRLANYALENRAILRRDLRPRLAAADLREGRPYAHAVCGVDKLQVKLTSSSD